MNRGRINQGIILILIGFFFLFYNLGWIDASFWETLHANWPVLLIFAGLYLVFARSRLWLIPAVAAVLLFLMLAGVIPPLLPLEQPLAETSFSYIVPGDVSGLELVIDAAAADVVVLKGTGPAVLGTIRYAGELPQTVAARSADRFRVELQHRPSRPGVFLVNRLGSEWTTEIPAGVPAWISVEASVGEVLLDLRGIDVRSVDVDASVGKVTLMLDQATTFASVRIDTSVADVELYLPPELALRIRADGTLLSDNVDTLGLVREGDWYVSPGYNAAPRKAEIDVSSSVGKLRIVRGQRA